jgi:hypothetical protein
MNTNSTTRANSDTEQWSNYTPGPIRSLNICWTLHQGPFGNWTFVRKIWGFHVIGYEGMLSSGMWLLVDLVSTDVSEESIAWRWRRYVPPKRRFKQDLHGATSQKTASWIFLCLSSGISSDPEYWSDHSPGLIPTFPFTLHSHPIIRCYMVWFAVLLN